MRAAFARVARNAVWLCVLLMPVAAAAGQAQQDQQALLEVVINGVTRGDTLVVLRGEDALVAVSALETAGLTPAAGRREEVRGEAFVSLRSLAPAVTFAVSELDLRLTITASANLLGHTVYDFQRGAPQNLTYARATSGFVNYALSSASRGGTELFTESAITARGALLYNTMTSTASGTVRGLTSVTFDDRARMRRWVIGDTFANTGALGGGALISGVTLSREFSLAPYFVQVPTISVTTPIATPSVVEVYVNDRLVREERVQPGMMDMRNLPLATGHNNTRIVVRDPFGATRELANHYYMTASTLAPGLDDYQYSLGMVRTSLGTRSFEFGEPAFSGRHRIGLNSWMTIGGRVEAQRTMVSGGPSFNVRLPVGELEAAAGVSRRQTAVDAGVETGSAARLSYLYSSRSMSGGVTLARTTARYTALLLDPAQPRPETEAALFVSVPLGSGSLSVQHAMALGDAAVRNNQTSITASSRVWKSADVVASARRLTSPEGEDLQASIGVTVNVGRRTRASVSAVHRSEGGRALVDIQRQVPVTTGVGYQVRAETGPEQKMTGAAQYQGEHGRYEITADRTSAVTVRASGAIVGIGGSLHATRSIRSSYALVQVPGVGDVRGYASNREIGKTDKRGNLLITDLLAYYANELSIADSDVPLNYKVGDVRLNLAPPFRGGVVARFPVQRVQRTTGRLTVAGAAGERIPAYGEVTVTVGKNPEVSPIGADGAFYFDSLAAGRHPAAVAFAGETCRFTIEIPAADADVVDLGALRCVQE